jgi:hypothetical protein
MFRLRRRIRSVSAQNDRDSGRWSTEAVLYHQSKSINRKASIEKKDKEVGEHTHNCLRAAKLRSQLEMIPEMTNLMNYRYPV